MNNINVKAYRILPLCIGLLTVLQLSTVSAETLINNLESIIQEQDYSYHENIEDVPPPEPWKRHYTEEERSNAKKLLPKIDTNIKTRFNAKSLVNPKKSLPRAFDLKTSEEIIIDLKKTPTSSYDKPLFLNQETLNEATFAKRLTSPTQDILDTTASPYSQVVKIFFDTPEGPATCSGSLIDPSTVLTAAHCLHDGDYNLYTRFEVIPAYKQRLSEASGDRVIDQPYGSASGISTYVWPYDLGFFGIGADFSQDIGVIRLDRPLGALTDWFKLSTSNACSTLTTIEYHSAGYPGQETDQHCLNNNGEQMAVFSMKFDYCQSTVSYVNQNILCGGQSGSGVWNSSKTIQAVISHSSTSESGAVMITSNQLDSIHQFENEALASQVDLIPLGVKVNNSLLGKPTKVKLAPGESLTSLEFLLHNHSTEAFSGNVEAAFYLSSNKTITSGDTFLGSYHWEALNIDSKKNNNLNLRSLPIIPTNIPSGTYYIGVIVENVIGEVEVGCNPSSSLNTFNKKIINQ